MRMLAIVVLASLACKRESQPPPSQQQPPPSQPAPHAPGAKADTPRLRALFPALPARFGGATPATAEQIALGRMLYFDKRLSKGQDLSCNSCHDLATGGVDHQRFSKGHKGQLGGRNSPTVLNAAGHLAQFWDGRAPDVEAQAKGPVLNPVEMAMPDEASVVRVLASIPGYVEAFAAAFPSEPAPITYDNFARAVGAFERGLVTPSRFDAYLDGDAAALSTLEQQGATAFVDTGCVACHGGALLGGATYQKLGLVEAYPTEDTGRMQVTGAEADRFVFKTPSLRNVSATAPYFHDGSIPDLDTAVRTMARVQLGRTLTDADAASIAAFLATLEAPPDPAYTAAPELPASGPETPPPDPT